MYVFVDGKVSKIKPLFAQESQYKFLVFTFLKKRAIYFIWVRGER